MRVSAIFDIGKTNKRFFLFDENYHQVYKESNFFDEIEDEDGDPCDNLPAIQEWVIASILKILANPAYKIQSINFSCYGASLVHIDKNGQPIAPLYNYLKPYPKELLKKFYSTYGDEMVLSRETASPSLKMLNSGLQLYYLKYAKPELFAKIEWSLHFPQYLSFLLTGIPQSEFTSIGCHTLLWDYSKNDYHRWVYAEEIDRILPPIAKNINPIYKTIEGQKMQIGMGIHDSSAALLGYIKTNNDPFILISTGTWSISFNPFNEDILTTDDLKNDCLSFLGINGKPVRAARIFLGNEYTIQVKKLQSFFQKDEDYHSRVKYDEKLLSILENEDRHYFKFESIPITQEDLSWSNWDLLPSFEAAYHQLMLELVQLQVQSTNMVIGNSKISKLYVDGGFSDNEIYIKLLSKQFRGYKIHASKKPLGSAIGAAIVLSAGKFEKGDFLQEKYHLKGIY